MKNWLTSWLIKIVSGKKFVCANDGQRSESDAAAGPKFDAAVLVASQQNVAAALNLLTFVGESSSGDWPIPTGDFSGQIVFPDLSDALEDAGRDVTDVGQAGDGAGVHRVQVGHDEDRPAVADQVNADQLFFWEDDEAARHVAFGDDEKVDHFGRQVEHCVLKIDQKNEESTFNQTVT